MSIVCATRGGQGSRVVRHHAIQYARTHNETIIFLFVLDMKMMGDVPKNMYKAIHDEMYWLGEVLLQIAFQGAEEAGVEAQCVILEGALRDQLPRYLKNSNTKRLFLGAPRGTTAHIIGDDAIELLAASLEEKSGVTVEIIRPENELE